MPAHSTELPTWLQLRIDEFETGPARAAPIAIWQITSKGKAAYFFVAPCCDRYNPLYGESGQLLCHPNGGIHGRGDGECPQPADLRTPVSFIWSHPNSPMTKHIAPALGQ